MLLAVVNSIPDFISNENYIELLKAALYTVY